jgi:hypothetical protein
LLWPAGDARSEMPFRAACSKAQRISSHFLHQFASQQVPDEVAVAQFSTSTAAASLTDYLSSQ